MRPLPLARRPLLVLATLLLAGLVPLLVPDAARAQRGEAVVRGTVTAAGGEALAGARVELFPPERTGELTADAVTDADGKFRLEVKRGLPGAFVLRIAADGYEPLEGPVELAPGQEGEVSVELVVAGQEEAAAATAAFNEGVRAFEAQDYATARERFAAALAADPELAQAHLGLAQVALVEESPEAAIEPIERYLAARPDDAGGHQLALRIFLAAGDEERIARETAALAGAGAEVASVVYNEGVAALRAGETERALRRFEQALELDPDLATAARAIATVHFEQRRYAEAAERAAALLERAPDDAAALRLRFVALEAAEEPAADAAFDAWAAVAPDAAYEQVSEWAEKDFEADHRESAERHLLRLVRLRPDEPELHYRLGFLYAGGGRTAEARERLERFLELAPDDPRAAEARELLAAL